MKLTSTSKRVAVGLLAAALPLSMAACSKGASSSTGSAGGELTMWTHNAGNKAELAAVTQIVNDYNASQKKYKVKIQAFPQDSYNQSVVAAAASKKLPCILDIDGPNVPNWAWALPICSNCQKHLSTPARASPWHRKWSARRAACRKAKAFVQVLTANRR